MPKHLFTFGYEGLSLDSFVHRLIMAGVSTVIDVRAVPLSRKPGFSKGALSAALRSAELGYVHVPAMGCPKPIRDKYRLDHDWACYTRNFLEYLECQTAALREIVELAENSHCCLLCFEADYNRCHRTYVGRAAAEMGGFVLRHITNRTVIPEATVPFAA